MQRSQLKPGSFLGPTLKSFRSDQLLLLESRYAPGFRTAPHSHEHSHCSLVLGGTCSQTSGSRTRTCATSSVAFHPSGETHSDVWADTGGRCLHLEFGAGWMQHFRESALKLDRPVDFRSGMAVWLAARIYRELRAPDDSSPVAIEGLALELAAEFSRKSNPRRRAQPPVWLDRVVDLVEARCREQVTVQEMAREAGVHPVHLATVFRHHLRCTPIEFLRRRRIDFAATQLAGTQASLMEISLKAGFGDQSHFCRVFKSVTGMTPTAYRQLFSRRS
jgi:AraC family transcriptional regulator